MKTPTLLFVMNASILLLLVLVFPAARIPMALVALLFACNYFILKKIDIGSHKSVLSEDPSAKGSPSKDLLPGTMTDLLKDIAKADAVAWTDSQTITAYSGFSCPDYSIGNKIPLVRMTRAMQQGETQILRNKRAFDCVRSTCECPFTSGVLVPLKQGDEITGSLGFFCTKKGGASTDFVETCESLAQLVSLQMQHRELERQVQLTTEARLDALQAQVNPHFLFNSLNAINMYVLKDPQVTRELIRRLSSFLRYTLGSTDRFTTVGEELKVVQDYLIIEKARFGERLTLITDVDENLKKVKIPILSIQPLVNNAIIHGLVPKEGNGLLRIRIRKIYDEVEISVVDNGIGIEEDRLEKLYDKGYGSGLGVGIYNLHERLRLLYGNKYGLHITSALDQGTNATFKIPMSLEEGVNNR
ncbi:histidine kinase [Alkalibacter rhizosphaerae]|uniref:histidine kinase n=1 Tax=Alkalibacter rhizosphaerae TaxID=2815577 RepID=A0A974XGT4_9FIRM|nr:histidine kinase [Alkalibacter rhizosphaerae]QSX09426.1 histidine kinase [Alkalibacter rhizosphaerae]